MNNAKLSKELLHITDEYCELFCDSMGQCYAKISIKNHYEIWALKSQGFKDWITHINYHNNQIGISKHMLQELIDTLEAKAKYENQLKEVYLRVAQQNNKIYIDLCNASWQVVEISSNGWKVLNHSPISFIRKSSMKAFPVPKQGEDITLLKKHINITDEDFPLIVGWLLMSLQANHGAYPILVFQSQEGSAKTTTTKMLSLLVDPNQAETLTNPKNDDDLLLIANDTHLLSLDNLSGIKLSTSDILCGLSTGTSRKTRKLFSNSELITLKLKKPIILNGIDDIANRGDFASRALLINLPKLMVKRSNVEVWSEFNKDYPKILGALFDRLSQALQNIKNTKIKDNIRMIDFAQWVSASESAETKGQFLEAYKRNIHHATYKTIESSTFANSILELMIRQKEWSGTATELLNTLTNIVGEKVSKGKYWITSPEQLAKKLGRYESSFIKIGITITKKKKEGRRIILLSRNEI